MQRLRSFIRSVLVALLLLAVGLPSLTYIILSTPWAQEKIRSIAETELTELLGSEVEIGRIDYRPFNTLAVTGISVKDNEGRKALGIARVAARFELGYFLRTKRLLFDYAVVDVPEINVWRASKESPLNIQPILDRFRKKDSSKPAASFDLKIGTIILREGVISYNVASEPSTPGRFNPDHLKLTGFSLHAYLRHASNNDLDAMIESMSFKEQSGLVLSDLIVDLAVGPGGTKLRDFEIELPSSKFSLEPISLNAYGFDEIDSVARADGISFVTSSPAEIATRDLEAFSPVLGRLDIEATAEFDVFASAQTIDIHEFNIQTADGIQFDMVASASPEAARIESLDFKAPGVSLARIIRNFNTGAAEPVARISTLSLQAEVSATESLVNATVSGKIGDGKYDVNGRMTSADKFKTFGLNTEIYTDDINLGQILNNRQIGALTAEIDATGEFNNGLRKADGNLKIISGEWNGHIFKDIVAEGTYTAEHSEISLVSPDRAADFRLTASLSGSHGNKSLEAGMVIANFSPEDIGIRSWRPEFKTSGDIALVLRGSSINDLSGYVHLSKLKFADSEKSLDLDRFNVEMNREYENDELTIDSDFLNGNISGIINPASLPLIIKDMASQIVPSLISAGNDLKDDQQNVFDIDLTIDNAAPVCNYLKLPVTIIYPVDIQGAVNSYEGIANISLDAPYLKQGDKIIDTTVAGATFSADDKRLEVYASTHMPTKKGPMSLILGVVGEKNRFDTKIDWEIERAIPLNGVIDFSTLLSKTDAGNIAVDTRFNPGQINFGEDVWNIHPSSISWADNLLKIRNFALSADQQSVIINGVGSQSPDDVIDIALRDITLISIFETLEIENAMIGGKANGNFKATQALSKMPVITTDDLHVDSISYNHCVIGTADVTARWDNDKQSVFLDADIINHEGLKSRIYGDIFVTKESLDLNFDANHVRVGFMQPFMAAFASEVSGYGSGKAHLFGTFHDIDMEGDIFADDVKLKIDFTNTVYSATDSVHITPGVINLENITIRDINGNTAVVNGVLTHEYFHLPRFNFRITDARNFLCYNITEAMNPDWYGTIYGNGSASVEGRPGVINIGANMSTAPGSTFTFVLSDRLDAEQYSFITFNDVTELTAEEKLAADDTPQEVKDYIERLKAGNDDKPSDYNLDFRVDITPEAQMILVMDPVGGDRIRAYGSGDVRLTYNSTENDIRMYGTYTLDRGNYNFTLQDIIIKDFTIDPGSSITFRGDPYSAVLNIEAAYQLNASLTDLDESFAMDKDLNRTNVPVQALLKVKGDMRQPDLDFDLRFPTLTSDTYRKVKSIISTDDMMNRQIIYLLALNRFYTPDYMESTTKGSELFSVASSTIASQLSNILGKLSDKWSIAPNLRSDRGDFSDVEVDVALSSRLLNNRLLLNGNLGYRDKSLNTNQFIGDFDLEYLLTPKGNWRLKGYSRYNDQNYYVRNATTTQGVGIMFRRDFDTLFPRRKKTAVKTESEDTGEK